MPQVVEKVGARVSRKWAGLGAAYEQKKLEARKMSVKRARRPKGRQSRAAGLCWAFLPIQELSML